MRTTLENVITDIKEYVNDNYVLNSCFSNSIVDSNKDDIYYPLVFLTYGRVTTSRGLINVNLSILLVDILKEDESNYEQVMSNMMLAAVDLKNYFRESGSDNACLGWRIDEDSNIDPFKLDLFTDHTAGYELNANIIIGDDSDQTDVPNGV